MKTRNVLCLMGLMSCLMAFNQASAYNYNTNSNHINPYFATSPRYDYLYANPPRQSIKAFGRYIITSSNVRYVHSPSRLKGVRHAAKINAYNVQAMSY